MHCVKKMSKDLYWVGGNDRRLALFEGIYQVPYGVSYNSYLLMDEVTVLFDTVDGAISKEFFQNVEYILGKRSLDYIIIHHMEPDHSALLAELVEKYPEVTIICNTKTKVFLEQFFHRMMNGKIRIVSEGDSLSTGNHEIKFYMAPMVHWPEVMVSYEVENQILFSADAFGAFGALNGGMFVDELEDSKEYLKEVRRYYCNIVGKYGAQVQALLKKASKLEVRMICPLHGYIWREGINDIIEKYNKWSTYTPEESGVLIVYASVYGNTKNVVEIVANRLNELGIKTEIYDVSVTPPSYLIAAAFKWSNLVLASTTYNSGIFLKMEEFLRDLIAHNLQNRDVALIENGTWAPTSGRIMRELLEKCKNMRIQEQTITIKSAISEKQELEIDQFVSSIGKILLKEKLENNEVRDLIEKKALFKISYGLYVLSAKDGEIDNGCIINTAQLFTSEPNRIVLAVNKQGYTHDLIVKTGKLNLSVLSEKAPFSVFQQFGFQSGREVNKFRSFDSVERSKNGLYYLKKYTNSFISAEVVQMLEYQTHTLFIAEVTEAKVLSEEVAATYTYYMEHIKPKPQPVEENKTGFICKVCGYIYEGEELPKDYICPICKHGVEVFEPLK